MELRLVGSGPKFQIFAIVLNNGECPAVDFLEHLRMTDLTSHRSMTNILRRHANSGQIRNVKQSRAIKGWKLFEFKTHHGARLIYFFAPGGLTILTHGFHKGSRASGEFERAEKLRIEYHEQLQGEGNGNT